MDRPVRKAIRLKNYDYSSPGAYFITICTRGRRCLFWRDDTPRLAVGAAIRRPPNASAPACPLTAAGQIVDDAIQSIPIAYPSVSVDKYVIMPNHIHLLLRIHTGADGRRVAAPTISTVVGQMKRQVSRQMGAPVWQKSFYEHIIRNETEYNEITAYIDANPARWAEDRLYPT